MGNNRFFFEEDPEAKEETGLTWGEHTNTFIDVLKKDGFIKEGDAAIALGDTLKAEADVVKTKHSKNSLLDIEFGIIQSNYAIHITPLHPHKNLTNPKALDRAVREAVIILNKIIPPNLQVDIFLPRADYELKAISFVIREGAEAWNLDAANLENIAIPQLMEQIGKVCMGT